MLEPAVDVANCYALEKSRTTRERLQKVAYRNVNWSCSYLGLSGFRGVCLTFWLVQGSDDSFGHDADELESF